MATTPGAHRWVTVLVIGLAVVTLPPGAASRDGLPVLSGPDASVFTVSALDSADGPTHLAVTVAPPPGGPFGNSDLCAVRWSRRGYDTAELEKLYTANDARVSLVLHQLKDKHRDPPGNRLEALKGEQRGRHSIGVNVHQRAPTFPNRIEDSDLSAKQG